MGNGERIERRATGVHRVITTNGNGDREDTYQFNVKRARALVGFLGAVFALVVAVGGAVMGGVRWGINSEVHGEVEGQIEAECEPNGMIDNHVRKVATELVDEFQEIVEDNIADADTERQEQRERSIRLEQRQIFIQEKMATDKEDLIREIQRAGDNG